jgi:hypothetical protein
MTDRTQEPISQDWIKAQIDALLKTAMEMPAGKMRDAIALRIDIYMDLVQAWRERT